MVPQIVNYFILLRSICNINYKIYINNIDHPFYKIDLTNCKIYTDDINPQLTKP